MDETTACIAPETLGTGVLPGRRRGREDRWHVLHSRSRQEKALAASLAAMRIDAYVPLRRELHLHGGRRVEVAQPVFPGYVFLWGDRDHAFAADRTRRVANVIPVSDQERLEWELENLHRALVSDAPLEPFPMLQAGARARVRSGPFEGIEGVVATRIRPERLFLQIRMLGTATSLEICGESLELLDP